MRTPAIRLAAALAVGGTLLANPSIAAAAWQLELAPPELAANAVIFGAKDAWKPEALCSRHVVLKGGAKLTIIVDPSSGKNCKKDDQGSPEVINLLRGDIKSRLIGPTPPKGVAQNLAPLTAPYFRALITAWTGKRVPTLYGVMFPTNEIVELTRRDDGRWEKLTLPSSSARFMALGDARNSGSANLYVLDDRLYEYRRTGDSWSRTEVATVHLQSGDSWSATANVSVSGLFTNGLVVADLRKDGLNRIYAAVDHKIIEMTHVGDSWRREEIAPGKGSIEGLAELRTDGMPVQLVLRIQNSGDQFRLKWVEGDRVVVADFGHGQNDFASSFSDFLRLKLVQIGNCPVLEREQMNSILAEHRFQETGAFSTEYAVGLGKLLNAKRVVVGRLGNLPQSRLANVNVVSVGTGLIEHSAFEEWRNAGEMEQTLGALALSICPGMAVK